MPCRLVHENTALMLTCFYDMFQTKCAYCDMLSCIQYGIIYISEHCSSCGCCCIWRHCYSVGWDGNEFLYATSERNYIWQCFCKGRISVFVVLWLLCMWYPCKHDITDQNWASIRLMLAQFWSVLPCSPGCSVGMLMSPFRQRFPHDMLIILVYPKDMS